MFQSREVRNTSLSFQRRLVVATVACAITLMSCGDDSKSTDAGSTPAAADLDGRTFLSTGVEGQTLLEGTQVSITFTADSLAAVAGCNTLTGGYTIDGSTLKVATLAQTLMACDADV